MQKWHFRIYGKVILEDSDKELYIHPENIDTLTRISDYKNEHMPKMLMRAHLDKNLIDYIVSNAETTTIKLTIEKFDKQDPDMQVEDRNYEKYIEDEFSIFVGNDINCNKEIDYKEAIELDEPERKDVYQEINIGMISKSCIEANKVTSNVVFRETAMMSMASYYMQNLHLLIEPFTYNPTIPQLTIPPQETLYKTIKFLNDIKVFYDTSFLFFIDEPLCTYLISRSGNGIEKKDDEYLDVCFTLNPKDGDRYGIQGMKKDSEESRFYADIDVANSRYTIDHDSAKIYTRIQEIINPEIKNTPSTLDDITSAINGINDVVNQVKTTANNVTKDFDKMVNDAKGIANGLFDMKKQVNSAVKDFLNPTVTKSIPAVINKFNNLIEKLPVSISGGESESISLLSNTDKKSLKNKLEGQKKKLNEKFEDVKLLSNDFSNLTDNGTSSAYKLGFMDNNLSCFDAVNSQNGVQVTNKIISQSNTDVNNIKEDKESIDNKKICLDETLDKYNDIVTTINDTVDKIEKVMRKNEGKGSRIAGAQAYGKILDELKLIKETLSTAGEIGNTIKENLNQINQQIDNFKNVPKVLNNAVNGFNNMTKKITSIASTDMTAMIKGIKTDLNNIGNTAQKALEKIRNVGKGSPLSFTINDLVNLSKSLGAIKDLSGIGKLGKSSFDTVLNIGQSKNSKESSKILKTINDNSNKIKNIKSDMENQLNQVYINKYDIDPAVFTPNKRYTIKNYNGHKDKDGQFILNRKIEVFIREDDSFLCNTALDFGKILKE